jgi:hypothetical protein
MLRVAIGDVSESETTLNVHDRLLWSYGREKVRHSAAEPRGQVAALPEYNRPTLVASLWLHQDLTSIVVWWLKL